jgi:uncharacterized paraquat-inducible protein A
MRVVVGSAIVDLIGGASMAPMTFPARWRPLSPALAAAVRSQHWRRRMSWLTRPASASRLHRRRETPDNLWTKCKNCGAMLYTKEFEDNLSVCPRCDHHERIGADARFEHAVRWRL